MNQQYGNHDHHSRGEGRINSERRTFIKTAVLTGGAAIVAVIPLASYVFAPALKKGTKKWIDFGPFENFEGGSMEMLPYEFMVKDGWLVLPQRGFVWAKVAGVDKITVFSSTCTHLACNVIWREETGAFECPCHSGRFDIEGRPIAGPPTKPLVTLDYKIEEGNLSVLMPT